MMLEIAVEADAEWDSRTDWEALARARRRGGDRRKRLPAAGRRARAGRSSRSASTGDEEVRALNAEWRGKDKPTNVLSFPMAEPDALDASTSTTAPNCCSATSSSPTACARPRRPKGDPARRATPRT